ncbi:MAG: ABC transporter permease, partial [Peptoniphilus harei]|nr:ABC transporter permease [Peptoniphilus harei]
FVLSITFNNIFSSLLNMPFLRPNIFLMILMLIIVIILGTLLGPISSIIAINKINKAELLLMQRDND